MYKVLYKFPVYFPVFIHSQNCFVKYSHGNELQFHLCDFVKNISGLQIKKWYEYVSGVKQLQYILMSGDKSL